MDALKCLCERVSVPQLTGPEVSDEQLEKLLQSALRAADHAWMHPSRYLVISGEARAKLGEIFLASQLAPDSLSDAQKTKMRGLLLRAPTVIVAICNAQSGTKVPEFEQQYSTAAGVQNMLNAAWALGLGAIWRTGEMAYNQAVKGALGLTQSESIIGFVYLGQPNCTLKNAPSLNTSDFYAHWS